ncbi:MAG TPA: S8 family serine peptidase, partial [Candidatus Limnocylindrales bacterium]|nr:S8 family serine peptidase [Candidatus Limnocylindrales bacterium]
MSRAVTVSAMILILTMAAPAAVQARVPTSTAVAPVASDWIVTVKAGVDARTAAPGLARQAGGTAGRIFEHALHGFVFHGTAKAAAALKRNGVVRTLVADRPVHMTAETLPVGIERIRASHPTAPDAREAGFTGAGARVAILDTGIDLTHPDLVAGIDAALGMNCITSGPPQDGHGHGTHVAGTIGARAGNNIGVIGVAPDVRLVPIKVLNDQGEGNWSNVICGIDHVTALATDSDPSNDVDVVNMSLGDTGAIGDCSDGGLREAICRSVGAGVVYVAAAGNSFTDASTFIPAAFPEVITVSAMTDFDGEPGGTAGCRFIFELLGQYCDDQMAAFSNTGSVIDVTAPGVQVYSTWTGGGYQNSSGTSMAAPHVAGVAALVRAANRSLTPAQVESLIKGTGEYPDGTTAESGCGSSAQWGGDPDGIAEPLVNALRAAQGATGSGTSSLPTVTLTPADGSQVSGTVAISATATHANGIASVQFLVDGVAIATDTTSPYTASWNSTSTFDGLHSITARATATTGQYACRVNSVRTGTTVGGDWVGTYGADGYALGGWNGTTSTSDLVVLPNASLTVEQGNRYVWANP